MKITLDLDQLRHDGRISEDEYLRFKALAAETTSTLALNIVLAFGIITVAGGTAALLMSAVATMIVGLVLACVGGWLCVAGPRWTLLGNILLPLGALTAAGGIVATTEGSAGGFCLIAALLMAGGVASQSGMLTSLSVFALLSALGGATGYGHASYFLCIEHPLLTVVVFAALAAVAHGIGRVVPPAYSRLADIAARTAVVVVNFGFWVGSLWGDGSGSYGSADGSEWGFIVGWAFVLLIAGGWGAHANHRWMVNTAATFGAIHLYTQWFEHLGPNPVSIILAGMFLIVVAYGLITYNRRAKIPAPPVAAA